MLLAAMIYQEQEAVALSAASWLSKAVLDPPTVGLQSNGQFSVSLLVLKGFSLCSVACLLSCGVSLSEQDSSLC